MHKLKWGFLPILLLIISAPIFGSGILKFSPPYDIKLLNLQKSFSVLGGKQSGIVKSFTFHIDPEKDVFLARTGGKYDVLKVKDLKFKGKIGYPQLPVKVFTFQLPENSVVVGVEVVNGKYVEIKNKLKIAPVPQPLKTAKFLNLNPSKEAYSADKLIPGKIISYKIGKKRKKIYGAIYFYPVQYNPLKKKAYLIYSAKINLYYRISGSSKNYASLNSNPECIIICPEIYANKDYYDPSDPLSSPANKLKNLHQNMGISTEIYTIEDINSLQYGQPGQPPLFSFCNIETFCPEGGFYRGGQTGVINWDIIAKNYNEKLARKILSFIADLADADGYDPGYVSNPNLKYIVLFGNSQDIPPSYYVINTVDGEIPEGDYHSWIPTDFFYSLADTHDLIPDFGVGRLPVNDVTDGDTVLYGTITEISITDTDITITDTGILHDPGDLKGMTLKIVDNASGGSDATGRYLHIVSSSYDALTNTLTLHLSLASWMDNVEVGDHYEIINLKDDALFLANKIVNWYSNLNYSWFKNVALCGGHPFYNPPYYQIFFWGELACLDVLNASDEDFDNKSYFSGMNVKKYFLTDEGYDESFKKDDIEPLLKDGSEHGFVYLVGNGGGDCFYFDDGTKIDTSELLNYDPTSNYHIPVVISPADINGAFDTEIWDPYNFNISFGESILFSPAGGIVYFGSTRRSFSSLFYSISSSEPGVIYHHVGLMPEITGLVFRRYHRGNNRIGDIFSEALKDYYLLNGDNWDNLHFRTLMEFTLLGDPALILPAQQKDPEDDYPLPSVEALNPRPNYPLNLYNFPVYEVADGEIKNVSFSVNTQSPFVEFKLVDVRYSKTDKKSILSPSSNFTTEFDSTDCGPDDYPNGPSVYFVRVSNKEKYRDNYSRERRLYIEVVNKFVPEGDILLIDDDEYRGFIWDIFPDYEDIYEKALEDLGYVRTDVENPPPGTIGRYKVWHVENTNGLNLPGEGRHGDITPDILDYYTSNGKAVIWFTGDDNITTLVNKLNKWPISEEEESETEVEKYSGDWKAIVEFIENGGKLFLTGENIGSDIGESYFYKNYLHSIFVQDDIGLSKIDGIYDDPLSDGISDIDISSISPTEIDPYNGSSLCILYQQGSGPGNWESSGGAGIRYYNEETSGALVYFSFGFEKITSSADRKEVLEKVLDWLSNPTPTGLFTAIAGDEIVTLRWEIPSDKDGVLIIRKEGSYSSGIPQDGILYIPGAVISDGEVIYVGDDEFYVDTGLENGKTYYYTCYSYDSTLKYSLLGHDYATPSEGEEGNLGVNLQAIGGKMQVILHWNPISTEEGFIIERKHFTPSNPEPEYERIAVVGPDETTYVDTDLKCDSRPYFYRLRSLDLNRKSNEASATPSAFPGPENPTNLQGLPGYNAVTVVWDDNTENETHYYIELWKHPPSDIDTPDSEIEVGPYSGKGTVSESISVDTSIVENNVLYIRVRASTVVDSEIEYSLYATSKDDPSKNYVKVTFFLDAPPEEGTGGGCFIATAAFGSPLSKYVIILKEFRDKYLLTNYPGRKFVSFYYKVSPPVARFLENHLFFKIIVRTLLYPVVGIAFIVVKGYSIWLLTIYCLYIYLSLYRRVKLKYR
ncbi:MAG TPA: hypothetical protein ENG68_01740 [bacterium]|nr:hypothetical protein [bacterium]